MTHCFTCPVPVIQKIISLLFWGWCWQCHHKDDIMLLNVKWHLCTWMAQQVDDTTTHQFFLNLAIFKQYRPAINDAETMNFMQRLWNKVDWKITILSNFIPSKPTGVIHHHVHIHHSLPHPMQGEGPSKEWCTGFSHHVMQTVVTSLGAGDCYLQTMLITTCNTCVLRSKCH